MRAYEPEQWMRLVDEYRITGAASRHDGQLPPAAPENLIRPGRALTGIGYAAAAMPVVRCCVRDRSFRAHRKNSGLDDRARGKRSSRSRRRRTRHQGDSNSSVASGTPMCLANVKVFDEEMNECPPESSAISDPGPSKCSRGTSATRRAQGRVAGGWFHTGDGGRRRGLLLHRRPHEGHDPHRRGERVLPRGRE